MSVIVAMQNLKEVTTTTLVEMLIEDVVDHADRLRDESMADSPDSEKVEYHHARMMLRIGQLKGVVLHHGR